MKKSSLAIAIVLTALFLTSCGTTQEVSSPTEPREETQSLEKAPEPEAGEISSEEGQDSETGNLDSAEESTDSQEISISQGEDRADENEVQSDQRSENSEEEISQANIEEVQEAEEEISEKVSDEDSYLAKEREEAPTSDEKDKVSEYFIFDEPEVIVHDLPEEPAKKEIQEEKAAEAAPETSEIPTEQKTVENAQNVPNPLAAQSSPVEDSPKAEAEKASERTEGPSEAKNEEEAKPREEVQEQKENETAQIRPSRSVKVKINQYLDVSYPGTGWVYIGESEKNAIFNYFGRKLGTGNTTFALRAKKAGNTLLHFYKNDALTGEYIDDYLEVTVESKKGTGRVKAPSYADIVPAKPQRRIDRANEAKVSGPQETAETKKAEEKSSKQKEDKATGTKASPAATNQAAKNQKAESSGKEEKSPAASTKEAKSPSAAPLSPQESDIKTVIQTTEAKNSEKADLSPAETLEAQAPSVTPISSESEITVDESNPILRERQTRSSGDGNADESLLEKAKKEFEEKKYADALSDAQEYYNNASIRLDEALFLLGQISESNSQVRDIRFAVDSYDMLVKRYPASKLWKEAKNRSIYLKRFYIDIR